ncbi:MAG: thiamine phosphate synthase [Planctomycetia bacterium]|nr:thiamine phosphate synthase [Planctomycetia bacterium]
MEEIEKDSELNGAACFRVIDASANRAREALRVIEDYVRFVCDDAFLTELLKNLRHQLVQTTILFPLDERLALRETRRDVGTTVSNETEFRRANIEAVLGANFSRLQESLRSLEEFSKISRPDLARVFEHLRYDSYTIERLVFSRFSREISQRDALSHARRYAPVSAMGNREDFVNKTTQMALNGIDIFELRSGEKDADWIAFGRALRSVLNQLCANDLSASRRVLFVVRQRVDIALLCESDGVMLYPNDLDTYDARKVLGTQKLVGRFVETDAQVRDAILSGVDFLGAEINWARQAALQITVPLFAWE